MRIFAAALLIGCAVAGRAVQVGDPRASVLVELGEPQNRMSAGPREFLNYPHGRVEITDGKVSDIRGSFAKPTEPPPPTGQPAIPAAAPATPKAAPAPASRRPKTARWYTDIAEAQAVAARENKLILALFTGTDWCPPCQQFNAEVENDEQFAGIFAGSFIFFKNDYLLNTPQSQAERAEVGRLTRQYGIKGYPTLLVLNAAGERLTKVDWTGPREGSFKQLMIDAIDEARQATKGGKKVSGGWWPF